ncbi:putative disease resistance protein RGA3 isoform X7 [Malus sylvestris]|uniref:putative disease resistance protein RGA3 isoform X7 n=1 Tax=Malus sylvestris TaxID=3752 RepID=UPI0021ABC484|nr:putative disease resistance protein RGA3 isoform X7 [Malus sylvestris]
MADAIVSVLLERLASATFHYIEDKVKNVLDVKKYVQEFTSNLKAVQAVLQDAERRQVEDESVRNWLDNLKEISYQMGDVLDEWNYEILRQQVEKQEREGAAALVPEKKVRFSVSSGCFCFGQVSQVFLHDDIAARIKELNESLTLIYKQRKMYGFHIEKGTQRLEQRITSSFVDVSNIFGRENEKDVLITKLLTDSSEQGRGTLIIPIVVLGGMGKTTLAQLVYNDPKVKNHFEKRIWVCVSDPFEEIKIAKAIIGNNPPSSNELDDVLRSVSASIEGKKFLLVLDDVWTRDRKKWEQLEAALIQSGAKGSRIVVTTRQHEVADMMRATSHMISMGELGEQFCLLIFNHMAFYGKEVNESNKFEDISREIVKKCKGLPLAAKTLGSLMRNKRTRREWQDVLRSKIWDLEDVEQKVFQPLLLSYYDLTPTVKCCLLYCVVFPKDYEFDRDCLINLWMAQDYLNSKGNKDKGMIGQTYFDNLVARSFFQDFEKDRGSGKVVSCKMHDIVHDFLQFLTKNECLIIEGEGATNEIAALGDRVRHLTLALVPKGPLSPAISSFNCKNLRTLTTFNCEITTISSEFLLKLKCLRTLNLSGEWVYGNDFEELPEEIGQLIHLKHIDLSDNGNLKKLPDAICELYNLCTLRLFGCRSLAELPDNMRKLISLKHLYIEGCISLKYSPKGIGRLTSLQTLDKFVACCGDKEEALQFEDLRTLNLQGSLVVQVSGDVKDVNEVEKAQLWDQKKLFHLGIDCRDMHYRQTKSSVEILNVLRPHKDLEALDIVGHTGTAWPIWMASLNHLRIVTIVGWEECEFLPPLGKLPSLEILTIARMQRVRKVGGEFLGIEDQTSFKSSPSLFPKLKELRLRRMDNWEEWEGVEGWKKEESEITIMPCLSYLEIYFCPDLKTLPDFLCKVPLQNLIVNRCSRILEKRCEQGSGEEWPKISHISNIHFLSEVRTPNLMHPENRNWRTVDYISY